MAKTTDNNKIERIREAAVSLISRRGIMNSSVADIAKEAGVSAGYLYRFYASKEELIQDLIEINFHIISDKVRKFISESTDSKEVITGIVQYLLNLNELNSEKIRFIIMLINDFSLTLNPSLLSDIKDLAKELLVLVSSSGEAREGLNDYDMYFAVLGVPMQYIAMRNNGIFSAADSKTIDDNHIIDIALNVIYR